MNKANIESTIYADIEKALNAEDAELIQAHSLRAIALMIWLDRPAGKH